MGENGSWDGKSNISCSTIFAMATNSKKGGDKEKISVGWKYAASPKRLEIEDANRTNRDKRGGAIVAYFDLRRDRRLGDKNEERTLTVVLRTDEITSRPKKKSPRDILAVH